MMSAKPIFAPRSGLGEGTLRCRYMSREILELPPPPADLRVPYGPDENQFGELWLPAGDGPYPVVVLIHGGYWRAPPRPGDFWHPAAGGGGGRGAGWGGGKPPAGETGGRGPRAPP